MSLHREETPNHPHLHIVDETKKLTKKYDGVTLYMVTSMTIVMILTIISALKG